MNSFASQRFSPQKNKRNVLTPAYFHIQRRFVKETIKFNNADLPPNSVVLI
jgi:hypothetical protein